MPGLVLARSRYLHVPKTGGNWVAAVLGGLFPDARPMARVHATRAAAPGPGLFTFAFVRHPLTWYQSYFSYKARKGWAPENDWDEIVRSDSFEEFVEAALGRTPGHYSKLLRWYVGPSGDEIDFIGRFERLAEDLTSALEAAGEDFDANVIRMTPPLNQSDYQRHRACYPAGLAERVLAAEAEAVERFYPEHAGVPG